MNFNANEEFKNYDQPIEEVDEESFVDEGDHNENPLTLQDV